MSVGLVRSLVGKRGFSLHDQLPPIPLLGQTEVLVAYEGGLVDCLVPAEGIKENIRREIAKILIDIRERNTT